VVFFGLIAAIVLVGAAAGVVTGPIIAIIAGVIALGAAIGLLVTKAGGF